MYICMLSFSAKTIGTAETESYWKLWETWNWHGIIRSQKWADITSYKLNALLWLVLQGYQLSMLKSLVMISFRVIKREASTPYWGFLWNSFISTRLLYQVPLSHDPCLFYCFAIKRKAIYSYTIDMYQTPKTTKHTGAVWQAMYATV